MKYTRNFDWEKESVKRVFHSHEEWNQAIDELDWNKYIPFEATYGVRTARAFWVDNRWSYVMEGEGAKIYLGKDMLDHEIWVFRQETKLIDAEGNETAPITGGAAAKLFGEKLKETNGKKLQARFGGINQFDVTADEWKWIEPIHVINKCVGPFVGNASLRANQYYEGNVYKADVSSAYPGEGMYKLPDLHTAQLFDYCIEPSEEWPIVMYLDTHHIAEYKGFDTRKEYNHVLYRQFRNQKNRMYKTKRKVERARKFGFAFDSEMCLAFKYSEYNLEEFKYFYERKGIDDQAKAIMNYVIGTFDYIEAPNGEIVRSKGTYYGHLRAVICARHNHNMIKYYDEIVKSGGTVLQVQTDSIMWQGKPIASAIREKQIGKLHLEIENGRAFIHGCGAYWVEDDNQKIEKHQGIKDFPKDKINCLEDFKKYFETERIRIEAWRLNFETLKFELMEV